MKILVVDDNALTAETLCEFFKSSDHSSDWASNGEAALTRLDYQDYDVVVIDYCMPSMNGLELLETIRSKLRTKHTPAVLVTAAGEEDGPEDLDKLVSELGSASVIRKPFEPAYLFPVIAAIVKEDQRK